MNERITEKCAPGIICRDRGPRRAKPCHGMTLLEIMVALLILGTAILPIARFLYSGAQGTRTDESETEALNAACDILDDILMHLEFEQVPNISPANPAYVSLNFTDIRFSLETQLVKLPQNFIIPTLPYHDPCSGGIEKLGDLDGKIQADSGRSLIQVDREKLKDLPPDQQADLMDIKLTVKWKRKGAVNAEYERNPIVLYTRKARL